MSRPPEHPTDDELRSAFAVAPDAVRRVVERAAEPRRRRVPVAEWALASLGLAAAMLILTMVSRPAEPPAPPTVEMANADGLTAVRWSSGAVWVFQPTGERPSSAGHIAILVREKK